MVEGNYQVPLGSDLGELGRDHAKDSPVRKEVLREHIEVILQGGLGILTQEPPGTELRIDFSVIVVGLDSLHPIVAVAEPTGIDRIPGGSVQIPRMVPEQGAGKLMVKSTLDTKIVKAFVGATIGDIERVLTVGSAGTDATVAELRDRLVRSRSLGARDFAIARISAVSHSFGKIVGLEEVTIRTGLS